LKKKKIEENTLTYPGIVFGAEDQDTLVLDELMRKFKSAERFSRERIFEGLDRKQTVEKTKPLFINNSRYMRDAFLLAEANILSQEELQPMYVEQYKSAIKETEKQIEKIRNSKKKYKEERIAGKLTKIKKLTKKMNFYQHHIDSGTVSKVVDGTKKSLKLLNQGKITKEEWRDSRTNQLYSRGEASKGGNENMKLEYVKDNLFLLHVLNPLSGMRNDRFHLNVKIPEKFVSTILNYLTTGKAYTIKIIRSSGRYHVHISLDSKNEVKHDFSLGCAGLDINPDNVSVTIVYPDGNFRVSKVFWMEDINNVSSDKRNWMIENTIIEAILWIKSFNVNALGIEKLKFGQKHSSNSEYNRMSHNFAYSKIISSIISTCFKEGVALLEIDAYYSSLIGRVKYQKQLGLSVHQAAAFVLARRAMGFNENIPKNVMSVLFAKEAKKGQKLFGLFTHWKKVSDWYSKEKNKFYKQKIQYKSWFFDDFVKNHLIPTDEVDLFPELV
jgi:predicted transposase